VVQHDKAPNFAINGTVAETVYNNARAILREIITDNMNDYQKVEAIYDWLIENVHYIMNFDATMGVSPVWSSLTTENKVLGNYKYNYLEGVFIVDEGKIREATSSGISKAFVLMCKIEGIDAIKVNGTRNLDNVNRVYSSWNKVELDYNINDTDNSKQWYTIDIVSSYLMDSTMYIQENLVPVYYQLPSHKFFLVTDSFVDDAGIIETSATQKVTSSTNANYYYTQTKFISSDLKVIFAKYSESDYNTPEEYIRAILKYMANEVNKKHNVFIAIDMADSNNATNGAKNMSNHIVRAGLSSLVKFSSKAEGSVLYIAMAPNK